MTLAGWRNARFKIQQVRFRVVRPPSPRYADESEKEAHDHGRKARSSKPRIALCVGVAAHGKEDQEDGPETHHASRENTAVVTRCECDRDEQRENRRR